MLSKLMNLSSLGDYTEQDLTNPNRLREIGNETVDMVLGGLRTLYNDGKAGDNGDIFENVFLEDGTKTVAQKIAEMTGDTEITASSRKELGNLLMAQAVIENKGVVVKPVGKSMEDAIEISAHFGDFAPEHISILDRILAFLGFKSDEIIKESNVKAIGKYVKSSAEIKLGSDALIEDTTMLAEVKRPVYDKAKKEIEADRSKLMCLYLNGIGETECANIEDANKRLAALPSSGKFNERSWIYMCACVMLRDGYSMEQIFNPDFRPDIRAAVGKEVAAIAAGMHSEDSNVKTRATSKLADLYLEGGKKILKQPMPPENELFNYTTSKSKTAIYSMAHMAFDLAQELERLRPLVLNNPRDRAVFTSLNQVNALGAFGLTQKNMGARFEKVSADAEDAASAKVNVRNKVIAMESINNVAKEMKFDYSGTIGEALKKNADKLIKFQAFSSFASSTFDKEVVPKEVGIAPLPLEKIMNGEESVLKRAEAGEDFQRYYLSTVKMHAPDGSLKTVYERAELANNIADKVEKLSGESFSKDVKDKLANIIFEDPNFNKLADVKAEKITAHINDQKFFVNYMNSIDAVEKVEDAQDKAKELSEKRKKINLSEDELKKIDEMKSEKANDAIHL